MASILDRLKNESEWQKLAAPWRVKGNTYPQPVLNYWVKMDGSFHDLTTRREIKLGDAKDRISAFLRQMAAMEEARRVMPTAPAIPPSPSERRKSEEATGALTPIGRNEPVLMPATPRDGGESGGGGSVGSKWADTGAVDTSGVPMTSASSQPVLVQGGSDVESGVEGDVGGSVVGGTAPASSSLSAPVLIGIGVLALMLLSSKKR